MITKKRLREIEEEKKRLTQEIVNLEERRRRLEHEKAVAALDALRWYLRTHEVRCEGDRLAPDMVHIFTWWTERCTPEGERLLAFPYEPSGPDGPTDYAVDIPWEVLCDEGLRSSMETDERLRSQREKESQQDARHRLFQELKQEFEEGATDADRD